MEQPIEVKKLVHDRHLLSKEEWIKKLLAGTLVLADHYNPKSYSYFKHLVLDNDIDCTFSYCPSCRDFIATQSYNMSNLYRHEISDGHKYLIKEPVQQDTLTRSFLTKSIKDKPVAESLKSSVGLVFTKFCCMDMMPFNLIDRTGFREFFQKLIAVGN